MNSPRILVVGFIFGALIMIIVNTWGFKSNELKSPTPLTEVTDHLVSKPFEIHGSMIYEFRNSQGGTCVLAARRRAIAVACMTQLPPMDFEHLPRPQ